MTVTDSQGCEAVASGDCLIDGVTEGAFPGAWRVFPNPASGVFYVEVNFPRPEKYTVEVHNTLGQVVWRRALEGPGEQMEVDLRQQGAGVYLVVEVEGERYYRLVVRR